MTDIASKPPRPLPSRLAQNAPVISFLGATFVWAWALWGYWLPAMPESGLVISPAFVVCAIVGGLAPSMAALLVVWLQGGRAGLSDLLKGLTHWRAPPLHFAFALGIVPVTTLIVTLLLPIFAGPLKAPDPAVAVMAVVWPLMAALGEELGWRGFLFPRLLPRYGYLGSALLLGIIWGVWHLPADYVGLKGYGGLFWLAFLVNGPLVLTAHALIMAWLWRRTGGNLAMMLLYHWTITASAMLAPSAGGQDLSGIVAAAVGAGAFWIVAILLWVDEAFRATWVTDRSPGRRPS